MKHVVLFLIYGCSVLSALGGPINGDPAPGRSPGPPINNLPKKNSFIVDNSETDDESNQLNYANRLNTDKLVKNSYDNVKSNNVIDDKFQIPVLPNKFSNSDIKINYEEQDNSLESRPTLDYPKNELLEIQSQTNLDENLNTNLCMKNYVKQNDIIVKVDKENSDVSVSIPLKLAVTHDVFDTDNGLVHDIIYTVDVTLASDLEIQDYYIESIINGKPRGHFIISNVIHSPTSSLEYIPNVWHDPSYNEYMPGNMQAKTEDTIPQWDPEYLNIFRDDINDKWEKEKKNDRKKNNGDSNDFSLNENTCNNNVWTGNWLYDKKISMNWTLDDKVSSDKNDTLFFRVLYRTMKSQTVFELIFTFVLLTECKLYLKHTTGNLDNTNVFVHQIDCTVYFPSRDILSSESPGLLVQLTRLNVPCSDGGYVYFDTIKPTNLCGKLEELPINDRTYYFTSHKNISVQLHKNPLFSLNYKLVDYCYNVSLTDKNNTFFLQPKDTLECYFKIHLPYGNKILLNLLTNLNESNVVHTNYLQTTANSNNLQISNEYLDLSVPQSDINKHIQCHGILVELHSSEINKWIYCIDTNTSIKKFTLLSNDNILVIRVIKTIKSSRKLSNIIRVPSLLLEYFAQSIDAIVSQCAFGWVANRQFCISAIEEPLTWQFAELECIKRGGHLASIKSDHEQKIIDKLLLNSPGYRDHNAYWIGASDKNFEGDFRWSNELPFTYSNWFPGWSQHGHYNKQPNDDGLSSQDCVELRRNFRVPPGGPHTPTPLSTSYMWNDRDCEAKNYFLCERPITDEPVDKILATDCNKTIVLTRERPRASIWSPGFPRQYPDNANCLTVVTAPSGYRLILDFEELVLENEPSCSYDFLEIIEQFNNFLPQKNSVRPSFSRNLRHNYNRGSSNTAGTFLGPLSNRYNLHSNLILPSPDNIEVNGKITPTMSSKETQPRKVCGDWSSKLKLLRYVTKGPILGMRFLSDYSHHYGGYKAKVAMENVASECPDERLKPYNGSCYLIVSYPEVDWWTAQQVCRGINTQLASISSPEEQRFITSNIRNHIDYTPRALYWLGGELADNQEYEWTDGTDMTFQGWLPGQEVIEEKPKVSTCLALRWKISPTPMLPSGLYWASQKCATVGGYVCKGRRHGTNEIFIKNQTISGMEGRLTSPGYPNIYPSNLDYWIKIVGPDRTRVIVQFQKIDLELQDECLYDYVSVQNHNPLSDFLLNPGTNPVPMAMFGDENVDMDYQNDGVTDDALHIKIEKSIKKFEKRLRKKFRRSTDDKVKAFNIDINNNNNNHNINNNNNVKDTVQYLKENIRLLGKTNRLIFAQIRKRQKRYLNAIEENKILESKNTSQDNMPNFLPYVRWCGNHEANMSKFDFISQSNHAILHFHSDFSISGSGFSATWNAVDISGCPIQILTAREGYLNSPNYPHFLLNNLECTFIIQAPQGKQVWLEIIEFNMIEDSTLFIDLGNGELNPFKIYNQLNDGVFLSKNEKMKVRIQTGKFPKGKGFRGIYKTINPVIEQRTLHFSNNTFGTLLHLNYPESLPIDVDFTQHLIAPVGEIISLELHGVGFSDEDCRAGGSLEIFDNYADKNGTKWNLCAIPDNISPFNDEISTSIEPSHSNIENSNLKINDHIPIQPAPVYVTSFLNTVHIRQKIVTGSGVKLNATIRVQTDPNFKLKLAAGDDWVESCQPNPCQFGGKCVSNGEKRTCKCSGYYTGRFCGLTKCDLEPCLFGQCELIGNDFKCHCQPGFTGITCDAKKKPCADNPCESRGECFEKNGGFHCRCHAWWEGLRCERRMIHIRYKPLSERMLQEPFWLGLITVFIVLAIIGLVWCAKRHFPEKIEKLLAEEADPIGSHHPSLREQLQFTTAVQQTATSSAATPGAPRTIFGRLGIRKPSILSLSSPQPSGGATARTFSLDDLLRPLPRRTPSPRKKRNNSTPTKKNAAEKKQILQQLISPANQTRTKVTLGELIQLSENRLRANCIDSESDIKETTFSENSGSVSTSITRPITDTKLEKKVTFARLLSKVSAEISSGSELDIGNVNHNCSALSLPVEIPVRSSSVPPSPSTNDMRSPHSTSSNQGSDSLSSSELTLPDLNLKNSRRIRPKVSSADSILAMFKNFASTNVTSSKMMSPSTTPTASSPQDDVPGDDDSSTSSIHTPISFSSGALDSPVFYRQSTIEVPVLDALTAHKNSPTTSLLHPPTILLEIPSNGNSKCLSPIREMPTPMPSPALTPIMRRPYRVRTPSPHEDPLCGSCSEDDNDDDEKEINLFEVNADFYKERVLDLQSKKAGEKTENSPTDTTSSTTSNFTRKTKLQMRSPSISIDIEPPSPDEPHRQLIIPTLTIEQPSPTRARPPLVMFPGSPPPQRASIGETSFMFPSKQQQKRLLKQFEKPTSLDLPFAPPMITVTSNMSEVESDAESISPAQGKIPSSCLLGVPGSSVGMCYLSPFSICTRGDRTTSESNLSSSGYSSMASPGPSRCGSNNPLCPSETEDHGSGRGTGLGYQTNARRQSTTLKTCQESLEGVSGNGSATENVERHRGRSDSETMSDPLLESNDEGIGTDHLDEKIEDGDIKSAKDLELYIEKEILDNGRNLLGNEEVVTMSQLQLPSIVVQSESGDKGLSPVSSRSESPLSERTSGIGRFSPLFYGRKGDQLPFTDSDGLYDFPSSDGKHNNVTHHRKSSKRRERKSSRAGLLQSPSKTSVHLEIPRKDNSNHHQSSKHSHASQSGTTRKSPKRRPIQRHPVASSSSSSESLTSARELTHRIKVHPGSSKIEYANYPPDNSLRIGRGDGSGDDTGEDISSKIFPKVVSDDTRPVRKINRLRAIGHQIRFLRRLEQSIKQKERLISPSDSCAEDFPQVTSPLLQTTSKSGTTRHPFKVTRQKRVINPPNEKQWREREKGLIHGDLTSD